MMNQPHECALCGLAMNMPVFYRSRSFHSECGAVVEAYEKKTGDGNWDPQKILRFIVTSKAISLE